MLKTSPKRRKFHWLIGLRQTGCSKSQYRRDGATNFDDPHITCTECLNVIQGYRSEEIRRQSTPIIKALKFVLAAIQQDGVATAQALIIKTYKGAENVMGDELRKSNEWVKKRKH